MKLWLLKPKNDEHWDPGYDKAHGFVIRADSERQARELAASKAGYEGKEAWFRPQYSTCFELTVEGPAGVILRDFWDG